MSLNFNGIPVFESALAVMHSSKWEVRKHPTPKRRKRWAPVRVSIETPCAFQTPMGLILHPVLFAQLKGQLHAYTGNR